MWIRKSLWVIGTCLMSTSVLFFVQANGQGNSGNDGNSAACTDCGCTQCKDISKKSDIAACSNCYTGIKSCLGLT